MMGVSRATGPRRPDPRASQPRQPSAARRASPCSGQTHAGSAVLPEAPRARPGRSIALALRRGLRQRAPSSCTSSGARGVPRSSTSSPRPPTASSARRGPADRYLTQLPRGAFTYTGVRDGRLLQSWPELPRTSPRPRNWELSAPACGSLVTAAARPRGTPPQPALMTAIWSGRRHQHTRRRGRLAPAAATPGHRREAPGPEQPRARLQPARRLLVEAAAARNPSSSCSSSRPAGPRARPRILAEPAAAAAGDPRRVVGEPLEQPLPARPPGRSGARCAARLTANLI